MQVLQVRPEPNEANGMLPLLISYNHTDSQLKSDLFSRRVGDKKYLWYFYYLLFSAGGGIALDVAIIKDSPQQMKQNTLLSNFLQMLFFVAILVGIYGFLTMMVGLCKPELAKIRRAITAFKILFVLVLSSFVFGLFSAKQRDAQIWWGIAGLGIVVVLLLNVLSANYMLKVLQQIEDNFPEERRKYDEDSQKMLEELRSQNRIIE